MAHRCKNCGRIAPAGQPFCTKDGCKKEKLPRCTRCNALYRKEKSQALYSLCPHSEAQGGQHNWSSDIEKVN